MGFGYLNKRKYADDLAHQRGLDRTIQDGVDRMMRAAQSAALTPPRDPRAENPPRAPQWIQQGMSWMGNMPRVLFQWVLPVVVNIPQALQNAVSLPRVAMEQAIGKVLSFFFGEKKLKEEEKERRERDDFAESDFYIKPTVEGSSGAGSNAQK